MSKMPDEWNNNRIKEILETEGYSQEQTKILRDYARYLKVKNFTLESQKTKLNHLVDFFKTINKEISQITEQDRKDFFNKHKNTETEKSMICFFDYYDNKLVSLGLMDFQDIQKNIRERRIESIKNYEGFNQEQKEIMNRFSGYLERKGLRLESKRAYLQNLKLLFLDLGKSLKEVTREDIDQYLSKITKYKKKTQTERRKFLILFYEWYLNKKKEEINLVSDIEIKRERNIKLPEEILSPEEIKKMIQVADNFRDKALTILLYETGTRKGEFLQLRIKHIELVNQQYGLITIPMGKTDSRKLPIIYSMPYITNWLNSHPRRDDPEAPLFVTSGAWLGRALGEDGLKRTLKILGKRAGIKKKIYPHLLRHSRLTELGKELTEQELKKFAGWVADSGMAGVYVHLSGSDVSNKLLANAGLIDKGVIQRGKDNLLGIRCPRCNAINPSDIKHCSCGFILDIKEVNKIVQENLKIEAEMKSQIYELNLIRRLSKISPEALTNFIDTLEKIEGIKKS